MSFWNFPSFELVLLNRLVFLRHLPSIRMAQVKRFHNRLLLLTSAFAKRLAVHAFGEIPFASNRLHRFIAFVSIVLAKVR